MRLKATAIRRGMSPFHVVNLLVSSIVARAGIAFAVLVGQAAPEGLENGSGGVVFRGNKSDPIFLTSLLGFYNFEGFRISGGKVGGRPRSKRAKGRACLRKQSTKGPPEHLRVK